MTARHIRPARLCRAWLFLEGANEAVLANAVASGADVLIHELEDFTPPSLRPKARALAAELYSQWRAQGAVVAVRVNPLDQDGMDDLAAVMRGRPDIVALPKVAEPTHVMQLADAEGVERETRWARRLGYKAKSTVDPAHPAIINRMLTPNATELARARTIVAAFDAARERGEARVEVDGALVEVPTYTTAKRLLVRHDELQSWTPY